MIGLFTLFASTTASSVHSPAIPRYVVNLYHTMTDGTKDAVVFPVCITNLRKLSECCVIHKRRVKLEAIVEQRSEDSRKSRHQLEAIRSQESACFQNPNSPGSCCYRQFPTTHLLNALEERNVTTSHVVDLLRTCPRGRYGQQKYGIFMHEYFSVINPWDTVSAVCDVLKSESEAVLLGRGTVSSTAITDRILAEIRKIKSFATKTEPVGPPSREDAQFLLDGNDLLVLFENLEVRLKRFEHIPNLSFFHTIIKLARAFWESAVGTVGLRVKRRLLVGCHAACDKSKTKIIPSAQTSFPIRVGYIDCPAILENEQIWRPATLEPLVNMPIALKADFLSSETNQMPYIARYFNEAQEISQFDFMWTREYIDGLVDSLKAGNFSATFKYGYGHTDEVLISMEGYRQYISGKSILVVGSETPWLEAILLFFGAESITTIDYRERATPPSQRHPRVESLHTDKFIKEAKNGRKWSAAATYSSIEHAGLGRYGDELNPWGHSQTMAIVHCVTLSDAVLFAGNSMVGTTWKFGEIPTGDKIWWNAGRDMGQEFWSHALMNWKLIDPPINEWGMFVLNKVYS